MINATELARAPSSVALEAHGTGTALGDPIEVSAAISALCSGRAPTLVRCSAIKSAFGHLEAVAAAVETHFKDVVPAVFHERVRNMYSWEDVGRRTSKVYDRVLNMQPPCFYERLRKKTKCGPIAGPLFCLFIAIDRLLLLFLELLFPARKIELCPPMQM